MKSSIHAQSLASRSPSESDSELSTCTDCGVDVDEIIGCPDGAEVCNSCFDDGNH